MVEYKKLSMNYFAYGSNMNVHQMRERGVRFDEKERKFVVLFDYEFRYNKISVKYKGYGLANINPKKGSRVEGVLYSIPDEDIFLLDRFEGFPFHYSRELVTVQGINGSWYEAVVYIAVSERVQEGLLVPAAYQRIILEGAEHVVSTDYFHFLTSFLVQDTI